MIYKIKNNKLYLPINILLFWLAFTVLSFAYGPYDYDVVNPVYFYLYLSLIHLFLFFGYRVGLKSYGRDFKFNVNYVKLMKRLIIIVFYYNLARLILSGGSALNILETFSDASLSYSKNISGQFSGLFFAYVDIIIYPAYMVVITNSIVNYRLIPRLYKIYFWFLIFLPIFSAIGSATRSGIVQTTIVSLAGILLAIYKKNLVLTTRRKVIALFASGFIIFLFLAYTSLLVSSRGGIGLNNLVTGDPPRDDFVLNRYLSPELQLVVTSISFYISHSYYRLNSAMNMPFEGVGFGFSNSVFVMDNIEKITGWHGLSDISYGIRLDKLDGNGDFGVFWSTFYTWIASDFTFPGVLIVIFFIGYFFALAFKDSLSFDNPLAISVFCLLFYFIFHFAFNNPLQDGQGLSTYLLLPIAWVLTRKKYF
jgi:hypothetical protein